ncbi:hypothetical protein Ddye_011522 [Dipteronia dyeriana]|uniref:Uncharacterized protein n=1 Tax=Dipteronia dyeriana TaxID=168575 RepID=A0AAD9X2P4_9ROSI|nr:hypothetical protein Ddye_011522 [Dipteronia dyeriana]
MAFTGYIKGCSKAYLFKVFENHSNQMAALDLIVIVESDIFLATYGGNVEKVVKDRRGEVKDEASPFIFPKQAKNSKQERRIPSLNPEIYPPKPCPPELDLHPHSL